MLERQHGRRKRSVAAASVRFEINSWQRLSQRATSTGEVMVYCAAWRPFKVRHSRHSRRPPKAYAS